MLRLNECLRSYPMIRHESGSLLPKVRGSRVGYVSRRRGVFPFAELGVPHKVNPMPKSKSLLGVLVGDADRILVVS